MAIGGVAPEITSEACVSGSGGRADRSGPAGGSRDSAGDHAGDDRSDSASRMISGDRWGRTGDHIGGSCVSGKRLGRSIGSCGWIASEILREIMPVTIGRILRQG